MNKKFTEIVVIYNVIKYINNELIKSATINK